MMREHRRVFALFLDISEEIVIEKMREQWKEQHDR